MSHDLLVLLQLLFIFILFLNLEVLVAFIKIFSVRWMLCPVFFWGN